ncbi:MAG: hypothetical protein AAB276_07305 [Pseudomonadota bacterium]
MFILIARFLKGIILGWIMALVFYLFKRMMKRVFELNVPQPQATPTPQKPAEQAPYAPYKPYTNADNSAQIIDTIWVGMSDVELSNIFGAPDARDSHIAQGEEIWTYNTMRGMDGVTRVTLSNGLIKNWATEKQPSPIVQNNI